MADSDWAKLQDKMQKDYDDIYAEYKSKPPLDRQLSNKKYDELFNDESQVDILEREGEYGFDLHVVEGQPTTAPHASSVNAESPLLHNQAPNNVTSGDHSSSELDEIEGMQDELTIIYKKFIICTIVIVILCGITFVAGTYDGFYNWDGITFNAFVVCVGIYGILIHLCCSDGSFQHTKMRKLKHFLIYFMIAFLCISTVFIIAIVYAVLLPIRVSQTDEYSDGVVAAVAVVGIFAVIFWTIFVLFYIDICARSCLKRGRIDFVIIELDSLFWNRLYRFVIWFRLRFRTIRRLLTAMTGIRCIRGRLKLNVVHDANKLHEEDRALAILEHDEATICGCKPCEINVEHRVSEISHFCGRCLCCPCLMCSAICEKIDPCAMVSLVIFAGVFAPLAMYSLLVLCVGVPCMISGSFSSYYGIPMILAIPLLYVVWYSPFGICPNNLFNTEKFPNEWNWTAQCVVWDYASLILLYIMEAIGNSK